MGSPNSSYNNFPPNLIPNYAVLNSRFIVQLYIIPVPSNSLWVSCSLADDQGTIPDRTYGIQSLLFLSFQDENLFDHTIFLT
jgi:hypothetical protein